MPRMSQTEPLVEGDLTPRLTDFVDLRNDNAGTPSEQAQNIVLRYLETAPSDEFVDFDVMAKELTRHWPFINEDPATFLAAVGALKDEGLIVTEGDTLQINKVAHVAQMWVRRMVARTASKIR